MSSIEPAQKMRHLRERGYAAATVNIPPDSGGELIVLIDGFANPPPATSRYSGRVV
ncbi:hypothetical protein NP284_01460 [Rhodopseudomonas pseudopalustris]|uniref:hypothetical protein n=1 Tax=Rhodopseudomonas TaxID=1073 RepID=UPI0015E89B6C|nr:hypothetical protein [Rhodopseudomonas faecalis]